MSSPTNSSIWLGATILVLVSIGAAHATPSRDEAISLAKATLVDRFGFSSDAIVVESALSAEWPDTSLGCPEKGKLYSAVITPGFIVSLRFRDRVHAVHVADRTAIICESSLTTPRRPSARKPDGALKLLQLVREDLASELEVSSDQIRLKDMTRQTWPDSSLGCPDEGEDYAAGEIAGYRIELEVAGERYTYHTGAGSIRACPGIQ